MASFDGAGGAGGAGGLDPTAVCVVGAGDDRFVVSRPTRVPPPVSLPAADVAAAERARVVGAAAGEVDDDPCDTAERLTDEPSGAAGLVVAPAGTTWCAPAAVSADDRVRSPHPATPAIAAESSTAVHLLSCLSIRVIQCGALDDRSRSCAMPFLSSDPAASTGIP